MVHQGGGRHLAGHRHRHGEGRADAVGAKAAGGHQRHPQKAHKVDVEGRSCGVDENLAALLGGYEGRPVTYAGGIAGFEDLTRFKEVTGGRTDFTIGSALDIFGGKLSYDKVKSFV